MKKSIVFIVCIFQFISTFSQTKHALIVAIANYPDNKIWDSLSSSNDVDLLKKMLNEQQFLESNCTYLIDKDATPENLDKAFESLIGKLKEGDIVYFHYSGHGQQVADIRPKKRKDLVGGDEKDGKDEALALYYAPREFDKKGEYEMEHHYVDDQMKVQFDKIRKKIGAKGQVILVLDACHSGTSTRGADNRKVRGSRIVCAPTNWKSGTESDTSAGFGTDFEYNTDQSMGKMVAFFGCKADQSNNEFLPEGTKIQYGSLTYFFVNGLKKLGEKNSSYANLFSEIRKNMLINWGDDQIPEIEGDDLNQAIFSNTFIPTKPFFNIESIYFNEVNIDAGTLAGLAIGDVLGLFDTDVNNPKDTTAYFEGKITEISALKSTMKLTQGIEEYKGNNGLYRVFLLKKGSTGAEIKVKLDLKKHKKELSSRLEKMSNINLVKSDYNYLVKELKGGKVIIYNDLEGVTPFKNMKPMTVFRAEQYDSLILFLKQASQIEMLRKLTCSDPNINFEVKFLNSSGKEVIEGITYQIEVLNTGNDDFHMQIIDIEPDSKMSIVKTKQGQPVSKILQTGKKWNITFNFTANPAGMDQFLFIATPDKIDLSPIEKLGEEIRTNDSKPRGPVSSSPLVEFINTNSSGVRGASSDPGEVTIKTLIFELKSKQ